MIFFLFFDYRKFIPLIISGLICFCSYAETEYPKMFLYQSDLPLALQEQERLLRKHVIDVILATQKYEVVFSEIPNKLSKARVQQKILKYKIRTDGRDTYRIELFLIDADIIQIIKNQKNEKIHKTQLLQEFRISLYEFILNKKLRAEEKLEFNKVSLNKIKRYQQKVKKNSKTTKDAATSLASNTEKPSTPNRKKRAQKNTKVKKSVGLWDLLTDLDQDEPWKESNNEAKDEKSKSKNRFSPSNLEPNPFRAWARIAQMDDPRDTLSSNQIHLAYKYVDRKAQVRDIIDINNDFFSPIGMTFEWVYYFPRHISPLLFRSTFELDYSTNTEPITMDGHSLFRVGFGYRLNYWYLPSIYYEQSNLNYANLNVIGDGIEANTHQIKWINFEQAFNGNQVYFSIHYALSVGATRNKDARESSPPTGRRLALNLRYFTQQRLWGGRFWYDIEYRTENFTREMTDQNMSIDKNEFSLRLGVYF